MYILGHAPESARAQRRSGWPDTKVVQLEFVVLVAHDELIGIVARKSADSGAQVKGGSGEIDDTAAQLVDVASQQLLSRYHMLLRKEWCNSTATGLVGFMIAAEGGRVLGAECVVRPGVLVPAPVVAIQRLKECRVDDVQLVRTDANDGTVGAV